MSAPSLPIRKKLFITKDNAIEQYYRLCKIYYNWCSKYNVLDDCLIKQLVWEKMARVLTRITKLQDHMDVWKVVYPSMTVMCMNHYRYKNVKYVMTDEEFDQIWYSDPNVWAEAMIDALPEEY